MTPQPIPTKEPESVSTACPPNLGRAGLDPYISTCPPPTISNSVTVVISAAAGPPHSQEGPWLLSGWALNGTSSVN